MNQDLKRNALEIGLLTQVISKGVAKALEKQLSEQGLPLSALRYTVLRILRHHPSTLSELSRLMNMSAATLVPVIDYLEKEQYVARARDPKDRRRNPLLITDSGRDILARFPVTQQQIMLCNCVAKMGAEKAELLTDLLRELASAISEDDEIVEIVSQSIDVELSEE